MLRKVKLLLLIAILSNQAIAQKGAEKKGALIGFHFNLADFKAANGIKDPITGNVYSKVKDMNKGFSLSFWKGITKRIDLAVKANAMWYNTVQGTNGENELAVELEPTLNIRPFKDGALIAPFLTAGASVGLYNEKIGGFIPAGVGIQVNLKSVTYLFVQAQYKFSLKPDLIDDNVFFSFGVAQSIGPDRPVVIPTPPPPVVEAPKDRDSDGIVDADDKCPDVKGVASLQGCPDADGDGITDADDKCPTVKGLAKYNGCPVPDTDKDGINDENDKCINVAGVARYQGCPIPDTDNDGVNDEEDKCINEAGPAANYGCPVIAQSVIDKINFAAKNIFYATGSSKLLPKSYKSLNEVAKIMADDKSLKLTIDGHTDNTGDAAKNQTLSETRAAAVKTYLASKGVEEDRMTATGHGADEPSADNKTAAGRAKNRRVEMKATNY